MKNIDIDKPLVMLGVLLEANNTVSPINLVVCGGAALIITGTITQRVVTKDVDVIAIISNNLVDIIECAKLPEAVIDAKDKVAANLGLDTDWLNTQFSHIVKDGLPKGFESRLIPKKYGKSLTVYFVGREDQICFKLLAAADSKLTKHFDDLQELKPTAVEIQNAVDWILGHESRINYKYDIKYIVRRLGYETIADRI
ncbi:MAG: DUF6036 family nucleotidyltransferase [Elusimicrobiota bacterium]